MEIIGYILSSIIGIMLGLTGGGGSILAVPLFVYIFGSDPLIATSYSLGLVGITSLIALVPKYKAGQVDVRTGLLFGIPSLVGVTIVRSLLMPLIPDMIAVGGFSLSKSVLIMVVFAVIMLIASWSMLRKKTQSNITKQDLNPMIQYLVIGLEGLVVGGITGFVGAGGGFLIIPALLYLTKLPIKQVIGTSLMIIAIKSLLGFVGDLSHLSINRMFFGTVSILSIVGMMIGNRIQHTIDDQLLKKGFGYFILVMGGFIIIKELLL